VKRADVQGWELTVYAIGEHFISPMHTRRQELQNVTVARSHGLFVTLGLRNIVWDFSTPVPATGAGIFNPASYPVDPVSRIGTAPGRGTVQKHLL
jgi:hypothetical protein